MMELDATILVGPCSMLVDCRVLDETRNNACRGSSVRQADSDCGVQGALHIEIH